MNYDLLFIFSLNLLILWFIYSTFGKSYALDKPDNRKKHKQAVPQIGGLVFGTILLVQFISYKVLPAWYLIGLFCSISLGALDDKLNVSWKAKLIIQIILMAFVASSFYDNISQIVLYSYVIPFNKSLFTMIFSLWFLGIINAVNLIDGLDGLAAGIVIIFCSIALFFNNDIFFQVNVHILISLVVFLIFNQRPAKIFMGDAGSLFLGFHIATLPLLFFDLNLQNNNTLNMTPFLFLVSFLVADTIRVFITRIISGENPMNPDTIHFHHLVIKNSGSYLTTLIIIYFVNLLSSSFSVVSLHSTLNQSALLIHFSFIFIFILTPPAPTYVSFISKLIRPVYTWNKRMIDKNYSWPRTLLIIFLFLIFFFSIFTETDFNILSIKLISSIFIIFLFILYNQKDKFALSAIQCFVTIFLIESSIANQFNLTTKLSSVLLFSSLVIFSIQRISGLSIKEFSSLDLLVLLLPPGSFILYSFGQIDDIWIFINLFVSWFSLHFIFKRVIINKRLNLFKSQ